MLKHLEKLTELVGRTVTGVACDDGRVIVIAAGDAYVEFEASGDIEDEVSIDWGGPLCWLDWEYCTERLVAAGVCTAEEATRAVDDLKADAQRRSEATDRREYERLKKKFEAT